MRTAHLIQVDMQRAIFALRCDSGVIKKTCFGVQADHSTSQWKAPFPRTADFYLVYTFVRKG
jgi:hypothetical protein